MENNQFKNLVKEKSEDELISILKSYTDYQDVFIQEVTLELINNRGYDHKDINELMVSVKHKEEVEKHEAEDKKRPLWQQIIGGVVVIWLIFRLIIFIRRLIYTIDL